LAKISNRAKCLEDNKILNITIQTITEKDNKTNTMIIFLNKTMKMFREKLKLLNNKIDNKKKNNPAITHKLTRILLLSHKLLYKIKLKRMIKFHYSS
jgi:predicted RNase H-like nuclease (RuvC/YqgF family)